MIDRLKNIAKNLLLNGERPQRFARFFTNTGLALKRISNRGIDIATIVDIGASDGRWSIQALKYWPKAICTLIEANPDHLENLKKTVNEHENFSYTLAAAGQEVGHAHLKFSEDIDGGTLADGPLKPGEKYIEIPTINLDYLKKKKGLSGPFLVKLDVHGYEVPILNGARLVLSSTNLVVIETYIFDISPDSLKFYEICSYMEEIGFRVIDLAEPLWRPLDQALWQVDLFFIRKDRSEFLYSSYK